MFATNVLFVIVTLLMPGLAVAPVRDPAAVIGVVPAEGAAVDREVAFAVHDRAAVTKAGRAAGIAGQDTIAHGQVAAVVDDAAAGIDRCAAVGRETVCYR